jgi:hypothetical protein
MKERLIDYFKSIADGHEHSPEYLADNVINLIEYTKDLIEQRDRIDRHIEKAVEKVNGALAELDKLKSLELREGELSSAPRAELLRHNLEVAKTEAGSFGDHAPITRAKIVLRGDDYQVDSLDRKLGDPVGKDVRCLAALEGFWFKHFGKKRGNNFYELVSIVLSKDEDAVKQAFKRQGQKWRGKMEPNNGSE